jgi:hypothetical protein
MVRIHWTAWPRIAFWLAALLALVMATLPKPPELPGSPSDKIQHILAFVVLAGLGAAAYRRASLTTIAAGLSAFGASTGTAISMTGSPIRRRPPWCS